MVPVFLLLLVTTLCIPTSSLRALTDCDAIPGRKLYCSTSGQQGLINQHILLKRALYLAIKTNRTLCVGYFRSDYRRNADMPMEYVYNIDQIARNLNVTIGSAYRKTSLIDLCVAYGNAASYLGKITNCAHITDRAIPVVYMNDLSFSLLSESKNISVVESISLTPGLAFGLTLDLQDAALHIEINSFIQFSPIFHDAARYSKHVEGLCVALSKQCGAYTAVHLRLEDDWIEHAHRLLNFAATNVQLNDFAYIYGGAVLSDFDDRIVAWGLNKTSSRLHISSGLGKGGKMRQNILDSTTKCHFQRKFEKVVMYEGNYFVEFLNGFRNSSKYDSSQSHFILEAIKNHPARELHAIIDLLIAEESENFLGIHGSTFSAAISRPTRKFLFQYNISNVRSYTESEINVIRKRFMDDATC